MSSNTNNVAWRFANAEVDTQARQLRVDGKPVAIEPKPFEVLVLLLEHAGELLTFEELLETAWTGRVTSEATVINTVFKIRKALGDDDQSIIKTIPKTGYRLVPKVERVALEAPPPAMPELTVGGDVPGRDLWQLEVQLGSGGHGDVWLARQKKTGEARVFKFCREAGRLSAFKREVTLNRLLRHALPARDGIARILEWNFDQPPYYIESEYAGDNLRVWAQKQGGLQAIPLELRLDLIARIATEVAAAHSVGVLHKDLKPENILIAEEGGALRLRLCDFGIGRLLDADRLGEHGITRLGFTQTIAADHAQSGTLLYMAPELLSSGTPSIQSDVYALGVLLYQVVTGKFGEPMAHGWEASVTDELLRQDIADATQGERDRRMASARILADRLGRLAERRAELARQQQAQQQAAESRAALERSRVRRPWLIAAIVLLVAGLLSSLFMAAQGRRQARLAQALTTFISDDVLNEADAYSTATPEISMRNAIVKALPLVGQRFADEPLAEASMDTTLAQALRRMTDTSDALALDRRAVGLYLERYGDHDVRTLASRVDVAADLHYLDKDQEAEPLLDSTMPLLQSALGPSDRRVFYARRLKAEMVCKERLTCPESLSMLATLIADIQATRNNDELLSAVKFDYAGELFQSGRLAEAERLLRQWLPEMKEHLGEGGYQTLLFRGLLGNVLLEQHRFAEAENEFRIRLEGMSKLMDPENHHLIGSMEALADAYSAQNRWPETLDLRMKSYQLFQKYAGDDTAMASVGPGVAEALDALGRSAEALAWAQKAVTVDRRTLPANDAGYLQARFIEARSLIHVGRLQEAQKVVDEVVPAMSAAFAGEAEVQPQLLYLQAELAKGQHEFKAARDLLMRDIEIDEKTWGADDPATRKARMLLQSIPGA